MDAAIVRTLNRLVRGSPAVATACALLAERLAGVEVALMLALALSGRRQSAVRMLAAVGGVYAASELLGQLWPRPRPFERVDDVMPLATHSAAASGAALLALAADRQPPLDQLAELRLALRAVLLSHLGGAPLKSWGLMADLAGLRRD